MEKVLRDLILEQATQIKLITHDGDSFLTELLVQQQQYYCIGWLCHFEVLPAIPPPPGSIPYAEVAAKVNVPVTQLRSVARMAMTAGFMEESGEGQLAHNRLSAMFLQESYRVQLLHMFRQTVPIMREMTAATEKFGNTTATNQTAYNIAHNTDLTFFQHLKSRPDLNAGFDAFMKSRAMSHTGSNVEHLLDSFDWAGLGEAKVVDVGGSSGTTAVMLAGAHPKLQLVVEDLPAPIENARARMPDIPEDIRSRLQLIEHDFFEPQPVKNADIYLLRTILHDWPDSDAVKILRGVVEAMGPASRLLIMDMVLPKPGSGSAIFQGALRQKDLTMLQAFNSKEREVSEWQAILTEADHGLKIKDIRRAAGSELSVIEVTLDRESVEPKVNGVHVEGQV